MQYLLGLICFWHSSLPPIQPTAPAIFAISSLSLVLNVPCLSGFLFFLFTMPLILVSVVTGKEVALSPSGWSLPAPLPLCLRLSGSRRGGLGGMLAGGGFGESAHGPELVVNLLALCVSFKRNKENAYWGSECDDSHCWFASAGACFSFRHTVPVVWCLWILKNADQISEC